MAVRPAFVGERATLTSGDRFARESEHSLVNSRCLLSAVYPGYHLRPTKLVMSFAMGQGQQFGTNFPSSVHRSTRNERDLVAFMRVAVISFELL